MQNSYTVAQSGVAALGTLPACVAGIDGHQRDTRQFGLVRQEETQLREGPRMQNCTLFPPGLNSVTDTAQFFNGDTLSSAFSFNNDLLGNVVVHPGRKTGLLPGEFLQPSLRGPGLFLLESGSQPTMPVPYTLDLTPAVVLPIGSSGDIGDSEVNPNKVVDLDRQIVGHVHRAEQEELATTVDKIGLPLDAVKPLFLVVPVNHRDDHPAFWHGPQADSIDALEAEDSLVVSDCAVRFEGGADLLIPSKDFHGLADGTDGHLSREAEPLTNLAVGEFVDGRLTEHLGVESALGRERGRFVHVLHRQEESLTLFGVGQDLKLECQFHYLGVYHSKTQTGTRKESGNRACVARRAIPLSPKGSSLPRYEL